MNFKKLYNKLFNLIYKPVVDSIFPPVCFLCDSLLTENRKVVCKLCWSQLKRLSAEDIKTIRETIICDFINNVYILYNFNTIFQNIIHLLKYERCLTLADYFAKDATNYLKPSFFSKYDVIIPVPLHAVKLRERGYNQSFEIVKFLPGNYETDIIMRTKYTKSQTTLFRNERIINMKGAFNCTKKFDFKNILLFDDILTTGSTINECAKVLKKSGATSTDVLCLAAPLKNI